MTIAVPPLAGVIGDPVRHSLSPILHGFWLRELALAGSYHAFEVVPAGLAGAIEGLRALGFRGANITIPHKQTVRAFVDTEDETAHAIGAINTLVIENGRITGSNSDAFGFAAHLGAEHPRWRERLAHRPALVLGAGGAARAVVYALAKGGAGRILIANRSAQRAQRLATDLGSLARLETLAWEDRELAAREAGLIVNATSLGMKGQPALALELSGVRDAIIADVVGSPLETDLLRDARRCGLPTLDGLGMLIEQARPGFKAWFGAEPPPGPAVRQILIAALAKD
jgi:shikimate dehydrogenase